MKRLLVLLLLSLLTLAIVPRNAVAQESSTLQPTSEQKPIKDRAEFEAYSAADKIADPAGKGAAMEAFVAKYPRSVVYGDALQQAMAAYQAAGDGAKVTELAGRLVKHDPKNVQALAVLVFGKMNSSDPATIAEAKGLAERGLKLVQSWKPPSRMAKADAAEVRKETNAVFYDAIGLADLYTKNYAAARDPLRRALSYKTGTFVENYRLAFAELEMEPLDQQGFWYIAKSIDLAKVQNADAAAQIEPYAAGKYKKYHGSMAGWDALLASAEKEKTPPKGFAVKPSTSP